MPDLAVAPDDCRALDASAWFHDGAFPQKNTVTDDCQRGDRGVTGRLQDRLKVILEEGQDLPRGRVTFKKRHVLRLAKVKQLLSREHGLEIRRSRATRKCFFVHQLSIEKKGILR